MDAKSSGCSASLIQIRGVERIGNAAIGAPSFQAARLIASLGLLACGLANLWRGMQKRDAGLLRGELDLATALEIDVLGEGFGNAGANHNRAVIAQEEHMIVLQIAFNRLALGCVARNAFIIMIADLAIKAH